MASITDIVVESEIDEASSDFYFVFYVHFV